MSSSATDEVLVERTLRGDEDAFSELYDRFRAPVFATAYRIIQDRDEALDLTQEIFVKFYRSLESWDSGRSKLSTWLYRLAANQAIDSWRNRRRRSESQLPEEPEETERLQARNPLADAFRSPLQEIESKERVEAIRRHVEGLPGLQKKVFVLRYFQGLKLEEIAAMESCSLGTVKTSLFRATRALQRALRRTKGMR